LVNMDQYELIRTSQRVYKKSIRRIARETGHARNTVRKVLSGQEPKYRRKKVAVCRVTDTVGSVVEQWLEADRESPRKQRHTSRRIYTRLVEEYRFQGSRIDGAGMGPGSEGPVGVERRSGGGAAGSGGGTRGGSGLG